MSNGQITIDDFKLESALNCYKKDFEERWNKEKYKWEAVKWFQDNWKIDAEDFTHMLKTALKKTNNLLDSNGVYAKKMILDFAESSPDEVREMFTNLFDESGDVISRVISFKEKAEKLLETYAKKYKNHFQTENAISTYLWLRYPDKYYIYKITVANKVADRLGCDIKFQKGDYADNLRKFYPMYDSLCAKLKEDGELQELYKSKLTDTNTYYEDPELRTLTTDFGVYLSKDSNQGKKEKDEWYPDTDEYTLGITKDALDETDLSGTGLYASEQSDKKEKGYWWFNANPGKWSFSNISVGESVAYTLFNENGNKRRIFQNFLDAKVDDMVIGYESHNVKQIVAVGRISHRDNEKVYFEKTEELSTPIDYSTLRSCPELEHMEYFRNPQGSLFKLTKDEYDFVMDMIRDNNPANESNEAIESYSKEQFLDEVYMTEGDYKRLVAVLKKKKNIILQGAPGVGKTFTAKRLAYSLLGKKDESHIEFVQFHQNYSYEDFVMGYKPEGDTFKLKSGIFYRFCQDAANHPDQDYFFIIDEINRGNMSKIFGELLVLIEKDYRGTKATLAYNGISFSVPERLYIIGMMNTADRSLAMIDYALRRRFGFFEMEPGFDSEGFRKYQKALNNQTFDRLIEKVKELNLEIAKDKSLGKGFCIGHSYFCGIKECSQEWMEDVVDFDILPMLTEYWFDEPGKVQRWADEFHGLCNERAE